MYKKYIVKKGKKIGPYYYTSVRQKNGKIRTVYLGNFAPENGTGRVKDRYALAFAVAFIILGAFIFQEGVSQQFFAKVNSKLTDSGNLLTGAVVQGGENQVVIENETTVQSVTTYAIEKMVHAEGQSSYIIHIPATTVVQSVRATGFSEGPGSVAVLLGSMIVVHMNSSARINTVNMSFAENVTQQIAEGLKKGLEKFKGSDEDPTNQSTTNATRLIFNQSCQETCSLNVTGKIPLVISATGGATVVIERLLFTVQSDTNISENDIAIEKVLPLERKEVKQSAAKKSKKTSIVQSVLESVKGKQVERGRDWMRDCNGGTCQLTLFSAPVHIKDNDGNYKALTEAVSLVKQDERTMQLKWKDYEVKITISDANTNSLSSLSTEIANNLLDYEFIYRYRLDNITVKPVIEIESNKEIRHEGTDIYLEDIVISFEDTIELNNFNVTPEKVDSKKTRMKLDKDYLGFSHSLGDEIEIDPSIRLSGPNTNNTYDGDVDDLGALSAAATTMRVGQTAICGGNFFRSFIDWNTTLIPDAAEILQLNLTLNVESSGDETTISITDMNNRSEGRSAAAIYSDAGTSTYVSKDTVGAGTQSFILGATANNVVEKNLTINEFNIGIKSSEDVACGLCECIGPNVITTREGTSNRPLLIVTYNMPPIPRINGPANATTYRRPINITLNATVFDTDLDNMTVRILAASGEPLGVDDLLHEFVLVQNGTTVSYNTTALPFQNESRTLVLFRLDNDTNFYEPQGSLFYDYTGGNRNFSLAGGATARSGAGKFAGAIRPLADAAIAYSQDCPVANPDNRCEFVFKHNITVMMWYNTTLNVGAGDEYLYSQSFTTAGFAIFRNKARLSILSDGRVSNFSNFFPDAIPIWHHLAVVLRDGNIDVYRDGIIFGNDTINTISASALAGTIIGSQHNGITFVNFFNGTIDDVAVVNRSFTATEVNNVAWLKSGWYVWAVNITDGAGVSNGSEIRSFRINTFPNVTSISLTPSPNANTTDTLTCTFTIVDDSTSSITGSPLFYNNSGVGYDYCAEVLCSGFTNGTSVQLSLPAGRQAKNETWKCGFLDAADDIAATHGNGDPINSSTIRTVNSPPNNITLFEPAHGNITTNTFPRFRWSYVDPDNDQVNFSLQIICYNGTSNAKCPFTGDDRNITTVVESATQNATTLSTRTQFYRDDNFYYNWTVNATDGENATSNAQPRNVSVNVFIDISMATANVSFGTKQPLDVDNTSDYNPFPIQLNNIGNSRIDVNLSGTDLFTGTEVSASDFQFWINETDDLDDEDLDSISFDRFAFNMTLSLLNLTNVTGAASYRAIKFLNFTLDSNTVGINIRIRVPNNEPPGGKRSVINFTGIYNGYI